jgi:hypothetical protein
MVARGVSRLRSRAFGSALALGSPSAVGCVNVVTGSPGHLTCGLRQRSGGLLVFWSVLYIALRRVLELVLLHSRSNESKELEIVVLRHQLHVLCPGPTEARGPLLPGGREPAARARLQAHVVRDARDTAAIASRTDRETLELPSR